MGLFSVKYFHTWKARTLNYQTTWEIRYFSTPLSTTTTLLIIRSRTVLPSLSLNFWNCVITICSSTSSTSRRWRKIVFFARLSLSMSKYSEIMESKYSISHSSIIFARKLHRSPIWNTCWIASITKRKNFTCCMSPCTKSSSKPCNLSYASVVQAIFRSNRCLSMCRIYQLAPTTLQCWQNSRPSVAFPIRATSLERCGSIWLFVKSSIIMRQWSSDWLIIRWRRTASSLLKACQWCYRGLIGYLHKCNRSKRRSMVLILTSLHFSSSWPRCLNNRIRSALLMTYSTISISIIITLSIRK